jgi:serine/threonine protein phosphatase PrpC
VEAGLIEPEEALHHEDLNIVSNMIGMKNMRIEVGSELRLSERDTVLLGSDGLFDNLRTHEIIECLRSPNLEAVASSLVQLASERMRQEDEGNPSKPDDTTFALFRSVRRGRRQSHSKLSR